MATNGIFPVWQKRCLWRGFIFWIALLGCKINGPSAVPVDSHTHLQIDNVSETPVVLVAIRDTSMNEIELKEWSNYVIGTHSATSPLPVWILCREGVTETAIKDYPSLRPFVVNGQSSWAVVFKSFLAMLDMEKVYPSSVGLFGEGSFPSHEVDASLVLKSLPSTVFISTAPTGIVVRSRSRSVVGKITWLSDRFVGQVWCNLAMLSDQRLQDTGLDKYTISDGNLLDVLPRLIRITSDGAKDVLLIDGTSMLRSTFAERGPEIPRIDVAGGHVRDSADLYIGELRAALVRTNVGDGGNALRKESGKVNGIGIGKAPWPPVYLLDHVATSNGLVVVSNVNCGYLDMATNFLLSVRRNSDAQVRRIVFTSCQTHLFKYIWVLDKGFAQ